MSAPAYHSDGPVDLSHRNRVSWRRFVHVCRNEPFVGGTSGHAIETMHWGWRKSCGKRYGYVKDVTISNYLAN